MARIPYATVSQYEELVRNLRVPDTTVPQNSLRMLAHAPAIGAAVLGLIHSIAMKADLNFNLRELAILRVAQRCQARYAWVHHAAIARATGVSDAQLSALERGEVPAGLFSRRDRIILAFTDEVLDSNRVSDELFVRAQKEFSSRELVELLLTIGYFRMIGGLLTTLNVEVDPPYVLEMLEWVSEAA